MAGILQDTRQRPRQKRAAETFDLILETAAVLLEEVGFDKLSTNLICERAGLTPPALYRYFPNKYAVLKELGQQLMAEQNQAVFEWLQGDVQSLREAESLQSVLRGQYDITCARKGGPWIMRSLHASPLLENVRLQSHDLMVEKLVLRQLETTPDLDRSIAERKFRITTETGYAMLEMLIDNPDLSVDDILRDAARMMAMLLADLPIGDA
ncbi:helix-turn-helix domain-containing protein [Parasphingorhabdus sp.]|uniref:TetR/AcrR family transcriptional regulator n=1 Tax=Parasphingorhabdus sp. TaxID=2709688 RepID=UPI003267147E